MKGKSHLVVTFVIIVLQLNKVYRFMFPLYMKGLNHLPVHFVTTVQQENKPYWSAGVGQVDEVHFVTMMQGNQIKKYNLSWPDL